VPNFRDQINRQQCETRRKARQRLRSRQSASYEALLASSSNSGLLFWAFSIEHGNPSKGAVKSDKSTRRDDVFNFNIQMPPSKVSRTTVQSQSNQIKDDPIKPRGHSTGRKLHELIPVAILRTKPNEEELTHRNDCDLVELLRVWDPQDAHPVLVLPLPEVPLIRPPPPVAGITADLALEHLRTKQMFPDSARKALDWG
jgi:hypothetical protein